MPNKALKVKLMIRVKKPNGEWRYFLPGNKRANKGLSRRFAPWWVKSPKSVPKVLTIYATLRTRRRSLSKPVMKSRTGKPPNEKPTPVESLNQALAAVTICQRRLGAKAVGLEITPAVAVTGTGHPLKESATIFLKFVEDNLEHVTFRAYSSAVMPFVEHCKKPTLESVVEDDVLAFGRWLRKGDVEHGRKP